MICSKCGCDLFPGLRFCPKCGTPVPVETASPADDFAPIHDSTDDFSSLKKKFKEESKDSIEKGSSTYTPPPYTPPVDKSPRTSKPYTPPTPPAKKNKSGAIIAVIIILIAILVGAIILGRVINRPKDEPVAEEKRAEISSIAEEEPDEEPGDIAVLPGFGDSEEDDTEPEEDSYVPEEPVFEEETTETPVEEEPAAEEEPAVEEEPPAEETVAVSEYVLPYSDVQRYSKSDIEQMTDGELRLARNEIYARHGRMFKDPALDQHFRGTSWYQPQFQPDEFDKLGDSILNDYEIFNRDLIKEVEASRVSP